MSSETTTGASVIACKICEKCIHKDICKHAANVDRLVSQVKNMFVGTKIQTELIIDCPYETTKTYADGYRDGIRNLQPSVKSGNDWIAPPKERLEYAAKNN